MHTSTTTKNGATPMMTEIRTIRTISGTWLPRDLATHVANEVADIRDQLRELQDRFELVMDDVRHLPGRTIGGWIKGMHTIAHPPGSNGEHAPQLAAAEHADHRAWQDHGSVSFMTDSVCAARYCRSLSRSAGRWVETMATASSAAFFAPAAPMANAPTGTPPGICTMESSESMPFSACDSTGTPSTGTIVCAATMPGR